VVPADLEMKFLKAEQYQPEALKLFRAISAEVRVCLPNARIEHIGASSIPGAMSKGDLDIFVGVPGDEVEKAVRRLNGLGFREKSGTLRTESLCMLETVKYGPDVAIQVVANGSRFEMFLAFRDRLRIDSRLSQSYNELKLESIGLDEDLYRERKSAFIEKTLSSAATRPNMNVPGAVVFDMDGLLLDTEKQALEAFLHACSIHGVTPHLPTYYRCIGRSHDTRQILIDGHAPGFPFDDVVKEWIAYSAANFRNRPRPVKAGAREILETVRKAGLPCALATSTPEPGATERLSAVDFDSYFDVMVTGDRVERGKPDPEIYLVAAAELGIDPSRCWALEDSANGVRAALGAGFSVLQIPDLVEPDDDVRSLGQVILPSLQVANELLLDVLAR